MVTFDEAYKIAISLTHNIDSCNEYEKAYHFFKKNNDIDGDAGPVVLKENGKAISFVSFLDYKPERTPKKITLPRKVKRG